MDFADGGKIDTVVYSASIGALNSIARAGTGAPIRIHPITDMAKPQNARVLPRLPDRSRLSVSPIGPAFRVKKVPRELSQLFRDAKTGCMIAHGNLSAP